MQQFVCLERRALAKPTVVGAVDCLYKVYQVLYLKYSPATCGLWIFMDKMIFEVEVADEPTALRAFRAYYHSQQQSR